MKKELNNMEELFKTELENLNVTPDEHMEDLIASKIDFEASGKSRKFNRLFIYLLIIGLISVVGCATLIFSRNHTNEMGFEEEILAELATKKHAGKSTFISLLLKSHKESQKDVDITASQNTSANSVADVQTSIISTSPVSNNASGIKTQLTSSINVSTDKSTALQVSFLSKAAFKLEGSNEVDKANVTIENPHEPIATLNEDVAPLVKVEHNKDSNLYKHSFGIGTEFAISAQKIIAMSSADTTWSITRNPLSSINLEYGHALFRNFTIQTGFQYQKWSENWERSHDTALFVTKDTIIFGVPAVITFLDTIKRVNKDTYTTLNFGIPLMVGYQFNLTNNLALNFGLGGLLSGTRVKQKSTYYNSSLISLERKQTAISFSPKFSLGACYAFNHFGIGLRLNYSKPQLGRIDLFERGVDRRNIGLGVQLLYRF